MFSNRLVMQLMRLVKAGGSADPTLTFPGAALAWETPHVPAVLWNSRREQCKRTVSGNEEGNSDNTEWPRMCINTQVPPTVLCCDHYKSRKFNRGWFVFPGTPEVSWGAVLFSKDLCNCFWKASISLKAQGPISFPCTHCRHSLLWLGTLPWAAVYKGMPQSPRTNLQAFKSSAEWTAITHKELDSPKPWEQQVSAQ